jgi:hypothetical protein
LRSYDVILALLREHAPVVESIFEPYICLSIIISHHAALPQVPRLAPFLLALAVFMDCLCKEKTIKGTPQHR